MSETQPISELFAEIIQWAEARGAASLNKLPDIWSDETDEWKVEINGRHEEIDGLPFAHARLTHKKYVQMAVLSPFQGALAGVAEDDLIEHFRAARAALNPER